MKPTVYFLILVLAIGGYLILGRRQAISPSPSIIPREIESSPLTKKPTNQTCTGAPTPSQAEGPYYKAGSPQTNNFAESLTGEKLIVTGYVFDKNCEPVANAWLDFWQANSKGEYDNVGFVLRGHQFTDKTGMYKLETIVPSAYESRPPHIHVKVRADSGHILTSQLYFPGETQNQTDSIFNSALIMKVEVSDSGKIGQFNFLLN